MIHKILSKLKQSKQKYINSSVEVESVYLLNSKPDSHSFLLESSMVSRVYKAEDDYLQSTICEDGTSYTNEIVQGIWRDITDKELDKVIMELGVKPLEIHHINYIMPDGLMMYIEIIDKYIIKGTVRFNSEYERKLWVPHESIKNIIKEDITNNNDYSNYGYWVNTRITTK